MRGVRGRGAVGGRAGAGARSCLGPEQPLLEFPEIPGGLFEFGALDYLPYPLPPGGGVCRLAPRWWDCGGTSARLAPIGPIAGSRNPLRFRTFRSFSDPATAFES